MIVGYFVRRGYYLPDAMQVFNRGQKGGPYWFWGGWNLVAVLTWLLSSALALLMVNIPGHFVGPLGGIAGGADVSLLAALCLPALLYPGLRCLCPEPRAVFGPSGPRGARAVEMPVAPVVARRRIKPSYASHPEGVGSRGSSTRGISLRRFHMSTRGLIMGSLAVAMMMSGGARARATTDAEQAVTAAEHQWLRSEQTNNMQLLAPLLADGIVNTTDEGKVLNGKDAVIADGKSVTWTSAEYADLTVTVFGHTAVAQWQAFILGKGNGSGASRSSHGCASPISG